MNLRKGELDDIPGLGDNLSAIALAEVEWLAPLPGHPRTFSKADIERARTFVARNGGRTLPVLIDDDNHVISGLVFVEAARANGQKTIRVIRQSGLSPAEALFLGTAVTKIQTLGQWDGPAMEEALRMFETQIEDFSASLIGFAPGELDKLIGASMFSADADTLPRLAQRRHLLARRALAMW